MPPQRHSACASLDVLVIHPWFARENLADGGMPQMTGCLRHLSTIRMDGREGDGWGVSLHFSLFSFLFFLSRWQGCYRWCCCMRLSQALSFSLCERVCGWVCAAAAAASAGGVVLRPRCAALSFRERSHRQPPQEARAPPPQNDIPPTSRLHPSLPPPPSLTTPLPLCSLISLSRPKLQSCLREVAKERREWKAEREREMQHSRIRANSRSPPRKWK